jgi:hypothetical protein
VLVWLAMVARSGPVSAQADDAKARPTTVPPALVLAGESAEDLYDDAKVSDWARADRHLARLKQAAGRARAVSPDSAGLEDSLEHSVTALTRLVAAKRPQAVMRTANQVTLEVADLTERFRPRVPVPVTRLDYYGRELEIWSHAGSLSRLRLAAQGLRREWDRVGDSVARRSPTEARKFGNLVTRVEHSASLAEYGHLAGVVLDEVDHLEEVFQR